MNSSAAESKAAGDWEGIWAAGIKPGERWDIGQVEPEFLVELQNKQGMLSKLAKRERALVPGCGRGYAALAAAENGFSHVLGLDIVPQAVAVAQREYAHERVEFRVADFFTLPPNGGFDLVLDSTFLCAIPPEMRDHNAWANKMQELIVVGGMLMMHIFPILQHGEEVDTDGPPYFLSPERVRELLHGFRFKELLYRETPADKSARNEKPIRGKRVKDGLMIWQRI